MIKLSRFTDYAVIILAQLVRDNAVRLAASDIADRTGLPEPTVAKVLKSLTRARVLTSARGVNGGYSLTRPAEAITVADIITALDGPISLTDCADNSFCARQGLCSMHGRWGKVNSAIRVALESVTLIDLMTTAQKRPPSGRGQGEGATGGYIKQAPSHANPLPKQDGVDGV